MHSGSVSSFGNLSESRYWLVVANRPHWYIVPTGLISTLPLHAAGTYSREWLDESVTVHIVPSLQALMEPACEDASGPSMIAVSDAIDLPFLHADLAVAKLLGGSIVELAADTTVDDAFVALSEAPIAVLSGHASHSLVEGGGLHFGADVLSDDVVARLPLRAREFAFVSACSSGQIALDLPDECVGLPSALLMSGFRSVVASLWAVRDRVAFSAS